MSYAERAVLMRDFSFSLASATLATALMGASLAQAQDYPIKPIRFLVPFPPGGATDAFARIMGQKMADTWGQQVVIDNRPGAGGNLAAELALKTPADGYTIIIVGMSHAVNISIYPKLNYDPERDFAGITQVAAVETFLAVHPSLPVKSVKDLIALAKARSGELNYGSGGSGAPGHLAMESRDLVARALEYVHSEFALEVLDLSTQSGLGATQRIGRRRHAKTVFNDTNNRFDVMSIHGKELSISMCLSNSTISRYVLYKY